MAGAGLVAERDVEAEAVAQVDAEYLERADGLLEHAFVEGSGRHGGSPLGSGSTERREAAPHGVRRCAD